MAGFIDGIDRDQVTLFPDRLEDWIGEDHLVRVVDLFVEELDLPALGFERCVPARTGRPGYHPAVLLKLFIYGHLNRIPSSRRLEREAGRNVELMWLTGRLAPDHKTIADFRRDNGAAIRKTCAQFVEPCRRIGVLRGDCVAIDGSKFKAVNSEAPNAIGSSEGRTIATSRRTRSPAAWRILRPTLSAISTRWSVSTARRTARHGLTRSPISPAATGASGRRSRG